MGLCGSNIWVEIYVIIMSFSCISCLWDAHCFFFSFAHDSVHFNGRNICRWYQVRDKTHEKCRYINIYSFILCVKFLLFNKAHLLYCAHALGRDLCNYCELIIHFMSSGYILLFFLFCAW